MMMGETERFAVLVERHLAGLLSPAENEELFALLQVSQSARNQYLGSLELHLDLASVLMGVTSPSPASPETPSPDLNHHEEKEPMARILPIGTAAPARTAAGMGYQTSRSTFAIPDTRKGKLLAVGTVIFILALGGVMYIIKSAQVNPEAVKEEMAKQIKDLQKLKPDQVIEIDNGFEAILAQHEPVKKYVAQIYANIEKEHTKVHQIASDLKKAMKVVEPFLKKYAQIKTKSDELKAQAQTLYDECRSLKESYGGTTLGAKLEEIQGDLMKILADRGPSWTEKIVGLQSEVRALAKKGEFASAVTKINEFGETFKEKDDLELFKKLNEQRDFLKRESMAFVNRKIIEANRELAAEGAKKDEIKKRLNALMAGLDGFKDALEKMEVFIATMK